MKANLHPDIKEITITCACGHTIKTYSTQGEDYTIEICSACHPFFTGKQRLVDTAGRVERFQKKYANVGTKKTAKKEAPAEGQ